jgi:hypothetical protein
MKHLIFSEQTESSHDEVEDGIKKKSLKEKTLNYFLRGKGVKVH